MRGRVSLTQYLKSQEDQDITRPRYDKTTQLHYNSREGRERVFCVFWNEGEGGFI